MMAEQKNLFSVYLRLRPPPSSPYPTLPTSTSTTERFLTVEEPAEEGGVATHITLNPPNDNRRRAVEKFAFTRVFEEEAGQLDLFEGTGLGGLVEGVLGGNDGGVSRGGEGRDGLLATLGVTGSGKSHTILGSRTQRGLTQLALDILFRSISGNILDPNTTTSLHATVAASDPSEAQVMTAQMFLDAFYGGNDGGQTRASSRALTPMVVCNSATFSYGQSPRKRNARRSQKYSLEPHQRIPEAFSTGESTSMQGMNSELPVIRVISPGSTTIQGQFQGQQDQIGYSQDSGTLEEEEEPEEGGEIEIQSPARNEPGSRLPLPLQSPYPLLPSYMSATFSKALKSFTKPQFKDTSFNTYNPAPTPRRPHLQRPSALPQLPDLGDMIVDCDQNAEYAILISMYEVYNDRIFDLLTPATGGKSSNPKDFKRRPLLFKPTESSPDRKVVAGLRKIICGTVRDALMVLEAGLHERRVAGTGSNSVSSRSHGFFCVEVKKRSRGRNGRGGVWGGSALTIVDLAGSERARDAKTQGATLVEAGKINESLMYLGQCLSMQGEIGGGGNKPNLVPYRQCKLTELLFSNSFPSPPSTSSHHHPSTHHTHRNPQKAIMIVTADPLGDFNATSQILRYSALAREVTVPRIPSVTSTILAASASSHYFSPVRSTNNNGRNSPGSDNGTGMDRATMEIAALEIARMSEEIDGLRSELLSEQTRRLEIEAHLESTEERMLDLESEIREQVVEEMELRMQTEMQRLRGVWEEERERGEGFLDRKLEIYTRSVDAATEGDDKENVAPTVVHKAQHDDLEQENERLHREIENLRRELSCRSPTKVSRMPLRESRLETAGFSSREGTPQPQLEARERGNRMEELRGGSKVARLERSMENLRVRESGESVRSVSPKKVRKLAARKWVGEDEDF